MYTRFAFRLTDQRKKYNIGLDEIFPVTFFLIFSPTINPNSLIKGCKDINTNNRIGHADEIIFKLKLADDQFPRTFILSEIARNIIYLGLIRGNCKYADDVKPTSNLSLTHPCLKAGGSLKL